MVSALNAPLHASPRAGNGERGPFGAHSFPPIENRDARVLVLGTMPGLASLRERQYYAHPCNAFWPIAARILDFDATAGYATRVASLVASGVALWDVLKSCQRKSSLDSDIDPSSCIPNDFAGFFAKHRRVRRVCFNGAQAEIFYMRFVLPQLPDSLGVEYVRLPSTSPAHAAMPLHVKAQSWYAIRPSS